MIRTQQDFVPCMGKTPYDHALSGHIHREQRARNRNMIAGIHADQGAGTKR